MQLKPAITKLAILALSDGVLIMYSHLKFLSFVNATLLFWLVSVVKTDNLQAQEPLLHPGSVPQGTVLRDDDKITNQTQLPWVVVSNQPNQGVPQPVSTKISALFTKEGLTPVSCSTNPVVIITINNIYIACASPTSKFPSGSYNANLPDIETTSK